MTWVLASALCLFAAASPIADQTPQMVVVSGRVLDGTTGEPIQGATITLNGVPREAANTAPPTDSLGQFAFEVRVPGAYSVSAQKPGYMSGTYGQTGPTSAAGYFTVTAGTPLNGLVVRMWRYAQAGGTVRDERGNPIARATVHALRPAVLGGQARLQAGRTARTDDLGGYLFSDLTPGRYVFALRSGAGASVGTYPTLFYQSSESARAATPVELNVGDVRAFIDFDLRPVAGFAVSGTVKLSAGLTQPLSLHLARVDSGDTPSDVVGTTVTAKPDGTFVFPRVSPGAYVIRAVVYPVWSGNAGGAMRLNGQSFRVGVILASPPAGATWWIEEPVSVELADVQGVTIEMRRGLRVGGRVVFDGKRLPPAPSEFPALPIHVRSLDRRFPEVFPVARLNPDGDFNAVGVPTGRYLVGLFQGFEGWHVRSILAGDQDVTGRSFDLSADMLNFVLTLSDEDTVLAGTILDAQDAPRRNAAVIVFPADQASWYDSGTGLPGRTRLVQPTAKGTYRASLFPGAYRVVAVADDVPVDWESAEFLRSLLPLSVTVDLPAGRSTNRDLRAVRMR